MDKRQEMVRKIREDYHLESPKVFSAMLQIPREKFIPKIHQLSAYADGPVSIGFGQTMSQPYTVAFMTHLLITQNSRLKTKKVLEIGTGSGYQAAVLSHLFREVYSIEIIRELANKADERLKKLGYKNIYVKAGSGEWGWKEKAPFDAIMITAGVEKVPEELFDQLKVGGVLVVPIGRSYDKVMTKYSKQPRSKYKKEEFGIFHFVPFVEERN